MKLFTLLVSVGLLGMANVSFGQPFALFNTSASIDIGNINASHLVHGDMWWDPVSMAPACEFPKGSGKHVGFVTAVIMSGYDPSNTLLVSAQLYRRTSAGNGTGTDYWPGPIEPASSTPAQRYASSQKWAKIWKIDSKQIDTFLSIQVHNIANTPIPILEWPAKGNTRAKGAGGATLSITTDMAPFVDVNADGVYDALAGDFPQIKGNQMLWWIINDDGPSRNMSSTAALRMEMKMSAYAYKRGTIADNIIFYEHELTNKSGVALNNFRLGIATEADLGYAFDDMMGFDSSYRLGVLYNGKTTDGTGGSGDYGASVPMMGIMQLEQPGDIGSTYVPSGSWGRDAYRGSGTQFYTPQQFNTNLHLSYPYGPYQFSLDSECNGNSENGDRSFILASNDLVFAPGATKKIATALLVSPNAGGCPYMSFTGILTTADTARALYRKGTPTTSAGTIGRKARLHVYPNPATDMLYVETGGASGRLSIFDALGRAISLPEERKGSRIHLNIATLPNGVYTIHYQSDGQILTNKFVKE